MTLEGRLTKDKFGYSMPVDAPLFPKPPFYFNNTEAIQIIYKTDAEAALDLLPEGVMLREPATAVLKFVTDDPSYKDDAGPD